MQNLTFFNLDRAESFKKLKTCTKPLHLSELLTAERVSAYSIPFGAGLTYNYAAKQVNEEIISTLGSLADEQQLVAKYRAIAEGHIMNPGEQRMVLHHLTRGQLSSEVYLEGKNLRTFYNGQQKKIEEFAKKVHNGEIVGSTGRRFDTVVQIGIGGSDLGPRALYLALKHYRENAHSIGTRGHTAQRRSDRVPAGSIQKMKAHFISNVDPDDAKSVIDSIDPETTLFIIVSKSGTTQETLTNKALVMETLQSSGIQGYTSEQHMVAVTSETSPMATSNEYLARFYIDDFIGGRYSSTSAVGGAILTLAFGPAVFQDLLHGANEVDTIALNPNIRENPCLMDALIGVYERNVLGYPCTAILPYSQALQRFPAHLQQLDMESNGKQVNRDREPVSYATGPVVFGEPGTNGQHSFYQLLHQGTDTVPLQFIGFKEPTAGFDIAFEDGTSQRKLNANLAAQIVAFAAGRHHSDLNKNFPGNRPSSLLHGERLTPRSIGALLAHFENKIMFQGLAWNINSFDQEGVQLGKLLTTKVLSEEPIEGALRAYAILLGVR